MGDTDPCGNNDKTRLLLPPPGWKDTTSSHNTKNIWAALLQPALQRLKIQPTKNITRWVSPLACMLSQLRLVNLKCDILHLAGRPCRTKLGIKNVLGPFLIQPIIRFFSMFSFLLLMWIWYKDAGGGNSGSSVLAKNSGVWYFYVSQLTSCAHEEEKKSQRIICCNHPLTLNLTFSRCNSSLSNHVAIHACQHLPRRVDAVVGGYPIL